MEASPEGHEVHENIPQVIEVIKSLLKETELGVSSANQKVDLWRYNSNLVFKPGEVVVSTLSFRTRVSRVRNCLVVGYGFVGRESVAYLYRETPTSARYGFRMEADGANCLFYYSTITVSQAKKKAGRNVALWLLIVIAHSGDDQVEREGWHYKVPGQLPSI
jgi:hypothetical protein